MLRRVAAGWTVGLFSLFQIACNLPNSSGLQESDVQAPGIAVVELFTSQGCSSCPPADEVLKGLNSSKMAGVLCLSFHVDYWNRLGWDDPYSAAEFTQRQRDYAKAFESERVYTPQMVVNGSVEFVGSKPELAQAAIQKALSTAAPSVVNLDAVIEVTDDSSPDTIDVYFHVIGETADHVLNIAVVQSDVTNQVARGENEGKRLSHINVVHVFKTLDLTRDSKGHLTLPLPQNLSANETAVIAYVQNKSNWRITGARRIVPGDEKANALELADEQWRKRLTSDQFYITRQAGTEPRQYSKQDLLFLQSHENTRRW